MYSEEEIQRLAEEEDSLTEEELIFLLAALRTTLRDLENEVRIFYQKYGTDGVVTYAEVRKWVDSNTHVRRLVLLNQTISELFEAGFTGFEKSFTTHLQEIIRTEMDFFGVKLDIDEILNTPWGVDNSTWLKRLLAHKNKWTQVINNDLKVSILKQDSILDVLSQMAKRGESMETILKRLWRTESNAISSIARKKIYETLGIKSYEFIHVDGCTCEQCSSLHGRRFPVSEYEVGVTANPLHPNCKDVTKPVIE